MQRPEFEECKTYADFQQYYWYLEELKGICKTHGIDSQGGKLELNRRICEYFKGNIIKPTKRARVEKKEITLSLDMKLLENGFAMRSEYREFFGEVLGVQNFHFTADMAAALKKVRAEKNYDFTIQDFIDVYTGKSEYAKYDTSSCQWNQFVKDFCRDTKNAQLPDKLKTAARLWSIIRNSNKEKNIHQI